MARKASTFSVTKLVATRREQLAAAKRDVARLQELAPVMRAAVHVENMVADHAEEIGFTKWSNISAYTYSEPEVDVSLEGYVNSLKTGKIVDLIERAMACGFEPIGTSDNVSDWASMRMFRFSQTVAGVVVNLKLVANIMESATSCRKVQVGTKLEEVAQYAIVCD
jgi:hypothetical protein